MASNVTGVETEEHLSVEDEVIKEALIKGIGAVEKKMERVKDNLQLKDPSTPPVVQELAKSYLEFMQVTEKRIAALMVENEQIQEYIKETNARVKHLEESIAKEEYVIAKEESDRRRVRKPWQDSIRPTPEHVFDPQFLVPDLPPLEQPKRLPTVRPKSLHRKPEAEVYILPPIALPKKNQPLKHRCSCRCHEPGLTTVVKHKQPCCGFCPKCNNFFGGSFLFAKHLKECDKDPGDGDDEDPTGAEKDQEKKGDGEETGDDDDKSKSEDDSGSGSGSDEE